MVIDRNNNNKIRVRYDMIFHSFIPRLLTLELMSCHVMSCHVRQKEGEEDEEE